MLNGKCYKYYVTATNGAGLTSSSTTTPTAITKVQKPAPSVTSISPTDGPALNTSYSVTITGTNFEAGAAVTINSLSASNVTVVNDTTITANTPSLAAGGPYDVSVTNTDTQTGTLPTAYTAWAAPTISSLSAYTGTISNLITITGTNFYDGNNEASISNCTRLTLIDNASIECETPATAGTVAIAVTTDSGTSSSLNYKGYDQPTISSISPIGGPIAGGNTVTITGTNFVDDANDSLNFAGQNISSFTVNGAGTEITFTAPAHATGSVDAIYTNPGGMAEGLSLYYYYVVPSITTVSPDNGSTGGGTAVTITGSDFLDISSVSFGGTAASFFTVLNPSTILATTPAHTAGAVTVSVTNLGGTGNRSSGFTYNTPTVTDISPAVGPATGGTPVTITGTNFSNVTSITFGGTAVAAFTLNSPTSISTTTPAHAAGAVNVVVANSIDSGSKSSGFTYYNTPTITNISPSVGPLGGTTITITGTNFVDDTLDSLTFGGSSIGSFSINGPGTEITMVAPPHAAGSVDVTYSNPGGTAQYLGGFTYINPPEISGVTPYAGPVTGGTSIIINGINFTGTTNVTIGGFSTLFSVVSDSVITTTTLAGTAGPAVIMVTTPGGSDITTFTYWNAPSISTISPNQGPTIGGQLIIITGTNFFEDGLDSPTVTIDGNSCAPLFVNSATEIQCETPAGTSGAKNVVVTTPGGAFATSIGGYTYFGAPTISTVTPDKGPSAGGQNITITGTNFYNGSNDATVEIGTMMAASPCAIQTIGPTQIVCNTGAAVVGQAGSPVDVIVTTDSGNVTGTSAYTYYDPPTISNINPNAGPAGLANPITITGTNFYEIPGSSLTVTVGGQNCTGISFNTTQITCTTPASSAGAATVTVTTPSSPAASSTYTFYADPTLTYIMPYHGALGGTNTITIYGTNLYSTTQYPLKVTFDGTTYTDNGVPDRISTVGSDSFTFLVPAYTAPLNSQNEKLASLSVSTANTHNSNTLSNAYYYTAYTALPQVTDPVQNRGISRVQFTGEAGTGQYIDNSTATPPDLSHAAGGTPPYLPASLPYITPYYSNFGPNQITNSYPTTLGIPVLEKSGRYSITVTQPSSQQLTMSLWIDSNRNNNFADDGGPLINNALIPANSSYTGNIDIPVTAQTSVANLYTRMRIGTNIAALDPGGAGSSTNGEYEDYIVNIQPASAPTLTSVVPNKGPAAVNTELTVNGTKFKPGAEVTFNGITASSVTYVDENTLTVQTPALVSGTTYSVAVRNPDTQIASLSSAYTAYGVPTVSNLGNTYFGLPAGGNTVSIFGTNFYNNSLSNVIAKIAGIACTTTNLISSTELECAGVPASASGEQIANTTVETNSGTSAALTNSYYYNDYQLPTVTDTSGSIGLSRVILQGEASYNLSIDKTSPVTGSLSHSGTPPSLPYPTAYYTNYDPLQSRSATDLTLGVPRLIRNHTYSMTVYGGGSSIQNVRVWIDRNGDKDFNEPDEQVLTSGCSQIPVGASCTFNIVPPSNSSTGETRLRVGTDTSVPQATGPNSYGEFEDYTVDLLSQPTPVVTSVTPVSGPDSPDTSSVTITGSNFESGAKVYFGTTEATSVVVSNSTTITATTPALTAGIYDLKVEQADGTSGTLTSAFHVYGAPTVTSITPDEISALTSGSATITGTNFFTTSQYPLSVSIGGTACANPSVTTDTSLTCDYPAKAAGTYDVSVTTGAGTGTGTGLITYYGTPTITSVDPSFGSTVGGTEVTITGTNFFPAGSSPSVTFGGVAATNVTVVNNTTITATTPAHAVGTVDIEAMIGSEIALLTSGFEYWPHPINTGTSTLTSYSSKIEQIDETYYDFNNINPVNAGLVKVTLYEQDYGTPATGREVTLAANPSTNVDIRGVECSNPHSYLVGQNLTDSVGTACFLVFYNSATPTLAENTFSLSATVINGNFNSNVTLGDTATMTVGNYSATSVLDYRYRNDDGNELTATPIANTNVPFYNAVANTIFRLRYGLTRNRIGGNDDLRFDEFSTSYSKEFGAGPGFIYNSFKAFAGGYAINESNNTLYVITPKEETTKAHVYKFNLNDLSQAPASFEFPATVDDNRPFDNPNSPITASSHNITKTFIDPDNNLMYFVLTPYFIDDVVETIRIYKVNLTTETVVDVLSAEMPNTDYQGYSYDSEIDLANGFMYVTMGGSMGALNPNPPRIMKIKLNSPAQDMTRVGILKLENSSNDITSSVIDLTNQFMYVTTGNPQKIVKIDLNVSPTLPPVVADEITLVPTPADSPLETVGYQSAVIDTVNGYAYFGSSTDFSSPDFNGEQRAFITKVDIDPTRTFEVVSRLNLLPQNIYADDYLNANYIYFPNPKTSSPITNVFPAASIDATNGYAFFPMSRFNEPRSLGFHKVMRIHLADFTRKSINDEIIFSNDASSVIKGTIFRPSTGRGYLIRATTAAGKEILTEFNSTNRQHLRIQVSKNVDNEFCNYASLNSYSWSDLPNADFTFGDSSNFTDGAVTTNVTGLLSDNNDSFVAGQMKDANATTSRISLGRNQFSEIEYAIQPTSSASGSYCFRLTDADPSHDNQVSTVRNIIQYITGTDYDANNFNIYVPITVGGLVLSKNTVNVIEGTTTDTYGIKLSHQPASTVTVIVNADDARLILSPDSTPLTPQETTLTFTTANWDTYQNITTSANNNGVTNGSTSSLIHHTVTSSDPDFNNIISEPVQSVVTDYGSTAANVRATVSGDLIFTPPDNFVFPEVNLGHNQPNFSPALTVSFDESRGTSADFVLTMQATDFCKQPGICIPLNKVFTANSDLINSFNTFNPTQIGSFISNYLQNGESLTDRSTYAHSNPSEDRPLSSPITLIDTRNVPSGNSLNPLQGILTFNLHLMIDYANLGVTLSPGLYTTTLVFDLNSNP
jgi:hypothetical protein